MSEKLDLKSLRVMTVSVKPHVTAVLRQVLSIAGVQEIDQLADKPAALALLCSQGFDAVFCDEVAAGEDFGHAARRTPGLIDPMLPIFLVVGGPRRRDVEAARDAGYTDVLTRPVSAATVARKLRLCVGRPRSFIAAPDFFGPDRRAQARGQFRGPDRRSRKAKKVKVSFGD